jgi:hypothetical protein
MRVVLLITLILLLIGLPLSAQNLRSIPGDTADAQATQSPAPAQNKVPDAPKPQESRKTHESKISASGKLPAILAPQITESPLNAGDKFRLYVHQASNPVSLLLPTFWVGLTMADPPGHYPREWKNGAEAFGRLYGDSLAKREAALTAQALTGITFREDPRYLPSASHNAFTRIAHALVFVLVDQSDSGHSRLASSNIAGAAANGFVGMAYLPAGYNDVTHAGQRALLTFQDYAISNVANEFCPEWGPLMRKMHLPWVHPPCEERIKAKTADATQSKTSH